MLPSSYHVPVGFTVATLAMWSLYSRVFAKKLMICEETQKMNNTHHFKGILRQSFPNTYLFCYVYCVSE